MEKLQHHCSLSLGALVVIAGCATSGHTTKPAPTLEDEVDDKPALVQVQPEMAQPQSDLSRPNESKLSQSEAEVIVILAQTNVKAREILKESRQQLEELTALCEMEDRGLFVNERKCTGDKLRAVHAQFCEWDRNLTASVSRFEKHQPFQPERTRLLLKNLKMITDEIRQMWGDFFKKYLQSGC
ncbi:hypothetical protein HZC21_01915 [Candidatus Peregrinibacteria bacterium]|nr:hypothetical protein [Candidatus Peregrinibacteria bacterium]